jgi:hypothetical protein
MANLDKLISAGLVPKDHNLSQKDIKVINKLSDDEIATLANVKAKLGEDFLRRNHPIKPNCFL